MIIYLSLSQSVALNDGQDQVRGLRTVVIDAVDRLHEVLFRFRLNRSSCIGVAIEAWEVAAGDLQPDTVPGFKDLGGGANGNVQFLYLVRLHQYRLRQRFAEASAQDAVGDRLGAATGIDIDELGGEIGIPCRGGDEQHQFDRTRDFFGTLKRVPGVAKAVVAQLDAALVARSRV